MKKETKRKIKWVSVILFIMYLILLTYFLFFAESYGRVMSEREYSYNLEPFREIKRFWVYRDQLGFFAFFTNIFGNILCFVPFGAIFPILSQKTRHFVVIVLMSFQFSLIVECIQLVMKVGSFDVDDLLLNTIGGAIGYLIFCYCNTMRRKIYG